MQNISIGNKIIGDGHKCYIIAEMSANHSQDKALALEIVHAAKESGADCIKIQTYTADTITMNCDNKYFKISGGTWDGYNLYKLYQEAYTPWEWQADIMAEAKKCGIDFFSTPFDNTAVDFLEEIGVEFYKIASFELVDIPLIRYVASKGKPIIMSTGMGTLGEIERAVSTIHEANNHQVCLLKCSSSYPAVPNDMNLATIPNMKQIFDLPVGLSDHSMGSVAAVTAVALGANVIEKHFCLSRGIDNPDASFSMEPEEFKNMCNDIRSSERAIGKISYALTESEKDSKNYRKSIFVTEDIKKGQTITMENIRIIRPGYGMEPYMLDKILGKKINKDIKRGEPFTLDNILD